MKLIKIQLQIPLILLYYDNLGSPCSLLPGVLWRTDISLVSAFSVETDLEHVTRPEAGDVGRHITFAKRKEM